MPLRDEKALRRPTFRDGQAVELGDGQEWTFPPHKLRLYPEPQPDGRITLVTEVTFGPEHDADLELLQGSTGADAYDIIEARHALAARLLLSNYDLDAAALKELLCEVPGDDASRERWTAIARVLAGHAPKASPGGSAALS